MKATITKIVKTEPDAWNGLTKTTFYAQEHDQQAYMFSKPGNVPSEGDVLEGEFSQDRGANWKFKRAQQPQGQNFAQSPAGAPTGATERTFKADPDKQESIEWQACLKAAVEAVRDYHTIYGVDTAAKKATRLSLEDYKRDIAEALVTFTQTIKHKPNTISRPIETVEDAGDFAKINPTQDEQPPVENYEDLVSDDINLDEIPF